MSGDAGASRGPTGAVGDGPVATARLVEALDARRRSGEDVGPDLDALARRAAADPRALDALLAALVRLELVEPAVRRVLFSAHDVEDAVQATLLRVAVSIGSFGGASRVTTWVHAIARNEALQVLRAASRRRARDERATAPRAEGEGFSSLLVDRAVVRQVVHDLPPDARQVVVLREYEGLSYEEIAERLGIPVGTVRSRLSAARAVLAARLAAVLEASPE